LTVLVDTNVLIDLVVDRLPWSAEAKRFFDVASKRGVRVLVTAVALPTLFYIVRRLAGQDLAFDAVDRTLAGAEVVTVDRAIILAARAMPGRDFEDNIQIACAVASSADAIVTRDAQHFGASPVAAKTPQELLAAFATTKPAP